MPRSHSHQVTFSNTLITTASIYIRKKLCAYVSDIIWSANIMWGEHVSDECPSQAGKRWPGAYRSKFQHQRLAQSQAPSLRLESRSSGSYANILFHALQQLWFLDSALMKRGEHDVRTRGSEGGAGTLAAGSRDARALRGADTND